MKKQTLTTDQISKINKVFYTFKENGTLNANNALGRYSDQSDLLNSIKEKIEEYGYNNNGIEEIEDAILEIEEDIEVLLDETLMKTEEALTAVEDIIDELEKLIDEDKDLDKCRDLKDAGEQQEELENDIENIDDEVYELEKDKTILTITGLVLRELKPFN